MTGGYNQVMTRHLEAVYEAGVLRPLEPLPFAERQRLTLTVTDEGAASFSHLREKEQEWVRVNGPLYAGQWVAVEMDRLVGQGESARSVLEQARAKGVPNPLIVQIPKEPSLPFGGW